MAGAPDFGKGQRGGEGAGCAAGRVREWRGWPLIGRGGGEWRHGSFHNAPVPGPPQIDAAGRLPFAAPPAARGPARSPAVAAAVSAVRRPGLSSGGASAPSAAARSPRTQLLGGRGEGATGGSSSSGSGAGSCCLGAEAARTRGRGGSGGGLEEPGPPAQKEKDEALEEKLRNLTFRKQVSYR